MIKVSLILTLFFLTSCASYIARMNSEMDRADNKNKRTSKDAFSMYRGGEQAPSLRQMPRGSQEPLIKRKYNKTSSPAKKRVTAADFEDGENTGSLWANKGSKALLFTENREKSEGDIILINVMAKLKNEITSELKRYYPDQKPKKKKTDEKGKEGAAGAAEPAAVAAAPAAAKEDESAKNDTVYDKVSTVVVEAINSDHVLLRGHKQLLFNNLKHTVEVQALVSRRDILENDSVNSSKIIESTIKVVQ